MVLGLRSAIKSDVGRRRTSNQDSGALTARLLVVADGMGGHAHGEIASSVTVRVLTELDARLPQDLADLNLDAEVKGALVEVTERLAERAVQDPDTRGMGTTVVTLMLSGEQAVLAHIGDSRIYHLRGGELEQLTKDHTMVQQLVDTGQITAAEALNHPRRSVLMRALSTDHLPEPQHRRVPIVAGDRFLLCSDGVTAVLGYDELREVLGSGEPEDVVERLVERANSGGGPDNITAIVADVVELPGDEPPVATTPELAGAASGMTPG